MVILLLALTLQTPPPSLGDAAKQAREAKEASNKPKATRVYTNDEMKPGTVVARPDTKAKTEPMPNLAAIEQKYRRQFAQLRAGQASAEARGKELADEMVKASPQSASVVHYYYNPTHIKQLQTSIDRNNAQLAQIKKKLSDLAEELNAKGYPTSWGDPQ